MVPLVILALMVGCVNPAFFGFENLINILRATSFTFIIGIGMTMVLVAAGLDLSVGSVMALGGCVGGFALGAGLPVPVAILAGVLAGAVIGALNGAIVVWLRIPPFVTTLGMFYMARGLVMGSTRGVPIYPLPPSFNAIGQTSVAGIPSIVFVAAVLGVVADFVLKRTTYGRAIYAIGGNEETARLSGLPVRGVKLSLYGITAALAAFTGLLQSARLGSVQPNIGQGVELEVIAAVIIGGTSLFGGAGTILGTFVGALFMGVLANGMSLVRVSPYWQQLVTGALIIVAVAVDQYRRRRRD